MEEFQSNSSYGIKGIWAFVRFSTFWFRHLGKTSVSYSIQIKPTFQLNPWLGSWALRCNASSRELGNCVSTAKDKLVYQLSVDEGKYVDTVRETLADVSSASPSLDFSNWTLCCTVLHCISLSCPALPCTALYCTTVCPVLFCTELCSALYEPVCDAALIPRVYWVPWHHLSGNQLSFIPEEIKNLKSLRTLNASENKIKALPPSLAHIRTLEVSLLTSGSVLSKAA